MQFYLVIVPTLLVSAYVFFALGFLGLCIMSSCLNSADAGITAKLLGATFVVAAASPLVAASTILIAHLRKKRLGTFRKTLIWAAIVIVGGFGAYQIQFDPGDASWTGYPMAMVASLLVASMLSIREP